MQPQDRIRNYLVSAKGKPVERRKIDRNTYARRTEDGGIAVKLHNTDIVTMTAAGLVSVQVGTWQTVATKARLNDILAPFEISQPKGIWSWVTPPNKEDAAKGCYCSNGGPFTDGDTIGPRGSLRTLAPKTAMRDALKLQKRIGVFAKRCADALPLEMPGNGDCLYCRNVVPTAEETAAAKGKPECKTLGDAFGASDHLLSHMEEGYVVPSLVLSALRECRAGDGILAGAFQKDTGFFLPIARTVVKRAVTRYLKRRLKLAA